MVCARPGFREPMIGQTVYVLMKDGEPVGATLRYPRAIAAMSIEQADDFVEVLWR